MRKRLKSWRAAGSLGLFADFAGAYLDEGRRIGGVVRSVLERGNRLAQLSSETRKLGSRQTRDRRLLRRHDAWRGYQTSQSDTDFTPWGTFLPNALDDITQTSSMQVDDISRRERQAILTAAAAPACGPATWYRGHGHC